MTGPSWTALMLAAGKGRRQTVEALLARGADVNLSDQPGATALSRAAGGDTLFLYDRQRRVVATALLRDGDPLVFTPDGWFGGAPPPAGSLRVFGASGDPLSEPSAAQRFSPERVRAALLRAAG